jgi:hypothetical protein
VFQIDWYFWIKFGFQHILDVGGYDHMLFLLVMFTPLEFKNWKTILAWVTAFTVGHSLTLALSTFEIVQIPTYIIENCIALTILWGASRSIYYVARKKNLAEQKRNYGTIAFFGLIHGLGFSNQLKAVSINSDTLIWELLGFNIGLELGQILFLGALFGIKFGFSRLTNLKDEFIPNIKYKIELFILGAAWICSLWMSIDRIVNSSLN